MFVKVWNKNSHDLKETFKGEQIFIKANSFIEMELSEAMEYKNQMFPIKVDGSGNQLPQSYKILFIEQPTGAKDEPKAVTEYICPVCKDKFGTVEDLEKHTDKFHLAQLEDQELAKKRGRQKNG